MSRKLTNYTSEIDQYLQAFDKKNPIPSRSQQEEQKKDKRIQLLRDTISDKSIEPRPLIWKEF